jgi:putative ABC transport system permease protein
LQARWRQYVLSATAIAIGVALVSGTVILAQSARASYSKLVHQVSSGIDLYVRGPETDLHQGIADFAPVSDSLLHRVRAVRGVAEAQGQVVRLGQLVSTGGEFLDPNRPTYVYSWIASKNLLPFVVTSGRAPIADGEVAIGVSTARAAGVHVGDRVRLSVDVTTPRLARVVGFVEPTTGGDLTGASDAFASASWLQRVTGIGDRWDLIEVAAAHSVSVETLRNRINGVIPQDQTSVITRAEYNNAQLSNLAQRSSSLTAILLALSLLAFVVGCGVVFTTFSVLQSQRTSELSLLRTIGMAPSQVYRSVVGEAVAVGLVAAAAGALAGVPAAYALRRLAALSGRDSDVGPIHFHVTVVIVAALLGALVCAAIATIPARRASRVAPVAAWREAQPSAPRSIPVRLAFLPAVVGVAGAILLLVGALTNGAASGLDEAGAFAIAIAVLLALPVCMPALLRVLGACATRIGAAGSVAGTSATASPRRVIAPVLALMLGLGMVTTVAVLASSAHAAMRQLVSRADKADFVVVSDSAPGIDVEALEKLAEAPSIRVVSEKGDDTFRQAGHTEQFTAVDTDTASLVFNLQVESGTLAHFTDGDIVLTREAAQQWKYHVGDYIPVRFGIPQLRYLRVSAIIADNGITHDWVIPFETYRRGFLSAPIRAAFIKGAPGTPHATLERQVDVGVAGFPGVTVLDAATYAQSEAVKAEGPIALVQALVGLSIVVALLGVANSLSLSVVERAWELGLLDVLGMTPAQVSLTVQWEAVFIAIAGIVFGVGAGLVLGLGIAQGASVHGFTRLAVPFGTIAGVSLLVVVAAFVAAAIPARRAVSLSETASVARI